MSVDQPTAGPHRTDRARGKRKRVAPGIFGRAGKYLIAYTDASGVDRVKTLGWIKSPEHKHGFTLRQAQAEREKLRVAVRAGEAPVPSRVTFGDVASSYFEWFESHVAAGDRSPRSLELYRQLYRTHIERRLAGRRVQEIHPAQLSALLGELRKSGLSSWTRKGIYSVLSSILEHARSPLGLIAESPLKRLGRAERPKGKSQTKARTLTNDECARLIASTAKGWRALTTTAVFTGLRISELLGLTWQDIDFEAGLVRVRYQLSRGSSKQPATRIALKSDAGERDVYLMPELATVLKRHRTKALELGKARPEAFVFSTYQGKPLSQRNATRALTNAASHAGLNREGVERLSFHDLRHTAISRLIAAGLDVVEVQRQAGHSKPSITLDHYSHEFGLRQERADDARAKIAQTGLGAVLAGSGS